MKRNRESKYRQKLINCLHKNKSQQRDLDAIIQKYSVTYCDMYQFAVKHDYSQSKDMISKMIECEIEETFKSFGDASEIPLSLFESTDRLWKHNKPYYLGVDFTRSNDCILGIEFDYGQIYKPSERHIDTQKESSHIRYVYYGSDTKYTGTIFTSLKDKTINNTKFYNGKNIEEVVESLESGIGIIIFWIFWILLTGGCVFGFYYIDNKWLE